MNKLQYEKLLKQKTKKELKNEVGNMKKQPNKKVTTKNLKWKNDKMKNCKI